jgi:energy-coupling factor transporter transmembrane protein EcfT
MAFVVHRSVKTADDVYDAMLSRGYSGSVRLLPRASGGPQDWLYLLGATCLAIALIGLDGVIH